MPESELKGRLLVASPVLGDPNFHRTVVLMIEHTPEGALGVVLNRPTQHRVTDALPGWAPLAAAPGVVFSGGPVEQERVLGLGRGREAAGAASAPEIVGRVSMVDLGQEPEQAGERLDLLRFFAGYAGWGAGQLEGELKEGAWFVLEAAEDDPFSPQPDALWQGVFRRQPGDLKWVSYFPEDPARN